MTDDERNITDEEIEKRLDPIVARVRASKESPSNPRAPPANPPVGGVRGLEGGVPKLLNADSMALQPSSLTFDHFDKSSTVDVTLININTEIDLFRSHTNQY